MQSNISPFVSRRGFTYSLIGAVLALTGVLGSQLLMAMDSVVLVGTGSSVPVPLFRKWAEEYNKRSSAIQLQYLPLGTVEANPPIGGGRHGKALEKLLRDRIEAADGDDVARERLASDRIHQASSR